MRFSSLLASGALAGRGGVLCRATPSCPFVFPDSFQHASLLTPLAFAFGFRAGSARAPFGVPARAVRPLRARALSALWAPFACVLRPLGSVRPRSLELQHYKSGASGVRCVRYRGFAPQRRSPSLALRPACAPLRCALTAFLLWLSLVLRVGVSGGCVGRVCGRGCRTALCA